MSIAAYEKLLGKIKLNKLLEEGLEAVKSRKVVLAETVRKNREPYEEMKQYQVFLTNPAADRVLLSFR